LTRRVYKEGFSMTAVWWTIASALLLAFGLLFVTAWPAWRRHHAATKRVAARRLFHLRREWLEAQFLTIASQMAKPRGLAWADCDFDDEVAFATDRQTGQLRAFVGVSITFRAEEDGGMEDNPNVGNHRAGTAVFQYDGRRWVTEGRAVLNLSPLETIERFHHELEMVD
jgi:hypothetical protein